MPPMKISAPCVVTLSWRLDDAQDQLIDELNEPLEFFYGGGDLLAKVEEAMFGQEAGFKTSLQLDPEHAFGDYDAELVCFEARSLFPAELAVGMQLEGLPEGAATENMPADTLYTVTEVYPEHVVLDGNHPLVGIALRMHLTVIAVRAATVDEVGSGSVGEPVLNLLNILPPSQQVH